MQPFTNAMTFSRLSLHAGMNSNSCRLILLILIRLSINGRRRKLLEENIDARLRSFSRTICYNHFISLQLYMRRRKCPRLFLPLPIFYFFHKKPVIPVPDYDFICYFWHRISHCLFSQPVMLVPQWCFQLISSARIGGGKKKQSCSGGLSSPPSLCCVK